jgi:hypothetical protein
MNQLNLEQAVSASSATSRRSLQADEPDPCPPEVFDASAPARLEAEWIPIGSPDSALAVSAQARSAADGPLAQRRLLPGWVFAGLGAVCVCAMVWVGVAGSHDCQVRPIPLALGVESNASVAVPANTPCTITVAAGSTAFEDIAIEVLPQHGTVTPRGRTGVTYRPAPRFKGEDSLAFSIRGRSGAVTGISVVRVHATVK